MLTIMVRVTFLTTALISTIIIVPRFVDCGREQRQRLPIIKFLGDYPAMLEMSKFLSFSISKFGPDVTCHTIIWGPELSVVLDYLNFCSEENCLSKYDIKYEGHFKRKFVKALEASYANHCRAYIILLRKTEDIIELLKFGDYYRLIDTRGRFMIWYEDENKHFEMQDIWKKIPNVIFFHSKLSKIKTRSKKISIKVLSLRWPLMPNTTTELSRVSIVDFWRGGRLARNDDIWYHDKTKNLKNITLRALVIEHPPFAIKFQIQGEDGEEETEYAGTEIEVLRELSMIMNFNFELIDADPHTQWGGVITLGNGTQTFYGAVDRLVDEDVDMALGSFIVLKKNLRHLDMSIPLDVACTSFLTPKPLPRPRFLALIYPFRPNVWILVVTTAVIFIPALFHLMTRLKIHVGEYRIFSTKWNCIFTSISILSQVSLHIWPKFWAMRMLIGWYWFLCLLITLAYRCAMVSLLSIPLFERPIDNVKDLAVSGLRVGGWGPQLHDLFTHITISDNKEMDRARKKLIEKYEIVENTDIAINLIANRKFAIYDNLRFLKFIAKTRNLTKLGSQTMKVMKQCILPVHIGFAYQKNSPIAPTINQHIRRFQESGLMRKWSQRLIARTKKYYKEQAFLDGGGGGVESEGSSEGGEGEESGAEDGADVEGGGKSRKQRVLTVTDLQGAIYLIIFGLIIAISAFGTELAIYHYKNKEKYWMQAIQKQKQLREIPPPATTRVIKRSEIPKDIFSKITQKALQVKVDREWDSTLREMGVLPKRKDQIKGVLKRKWRRVKEFVGRKKFPFEYLE